MGENPITPVFEVRLSESAIPPLAQWLLKAESLGEFSDVRYKSAQVQALLQAQFYARFIDLALAALICLAAALALAGLWTLRQSRPLPGREVAAILAAAAGGAAAGAAAVCVMVLPMRALSPWWEWPPAAAQAALIFGAAAAGWMLCARTD